eukprot:6949350-Prymnesium_polylepis.1
MFSYATTLTDDNLHHTSSVPPPTAFTPQSSAFWTSTPPKAAGRQCACVALDCPWSSALRM